MTRRGSHEHALSPRHAVRPASSTALRAALGAMVSLSASLGGCARPDAPVTAPAPTTAAAPAELPACIDTGDDPPGLLVSEPQRAAGIPCLRYNVKIEGAPTRGPDDAPVTIVMFSDFECPFCARAMETMAALERRYDGKIRLVYKSFPIDRHPQAMLAALMALSVRDQGAFWAFHDRLFSGQGISTPALLGYIEELGLDLTRIASELDDMTHAPEIRRDLDQAAALMVRSTPTFFINGRRVSGAKPMPLFERLVEEELALTSMWTKQGVPAGELYGHATGLGYEALEYEEERRGLDADLAYDVPIEDSPALGPADAPVTVVVFGDFECPFCVRGYETVRELRQRYGDELRLVYKHFPLPGHAAAIPAARASMAAHEQDAFWAFHDALYARGARFRVEELRSIAEEIGLDMSRFDASLSNRSFDAQIKRDIDLGMRLGVSGTPTAFINGRPLEGAQPALNFRAIIAEELEAARALRASGVPARDIYTRRTQRSTSPSAGAEGDASTPSP